MPPKGVTAAESPSARSRKVAEKTERRENFIYSDDPEPHAARKKVIMAAHPEIKELMGHEPLTKYCVAATVAIQIATAITVRDWSWGWFCVAAYVIGGTANHSLFLAVHELSHNLGAKSLWGNRAISFMANLPITIPYACSFKPYHMDHHRYQGDVDLDADLPTPLEAWVLSGSSGSYIGHTLRKLFFATFQILFYALRPTFVDPRRVPKDRVMLANYTVQILFDIFMFKTFGLNTLFYLLLSTFFAGSLHPTAGHFIAEHYVTNGVTETYSYYGPLNMLTYNVGYHNEHHDFPNIPGSRLPQVKKIAPEFYDHLPQCKSWPGMVFTYIFDDKCGPYARVTRGGKKE